MLNGANLLRGKLGELILTLSVDQLGEELEALVEGLVLHGLVARCIRNDIEVVSQLITPLLKGICEFASGGELAFGEHVLVLDEVD